jgi:hypothetical protein
VPVLVTVTEVAALRFPTLTAPKSTECGVTENFEVVADPDSVTAMNPAFAVAMVSRPEVSPASCGAKVTRTVHALPGGRMVPAQPESMTNGCVIETVVTESLASLVLDTRTDLAGLCSPTETAPKPIEVGRTVTARPAPGPEGLAVLAAARSGPVVNVRRWLPCRVGDKAGPTRQVEPVGAAWQPETRPTRTASLAAATWPSSSEVMLTTLRHGVGAPAPDGTRTVVAMSTASLRCMIDVPFELPAIAPAGAVKPIPVPSTPNTIIPSAARLCRPVRRRPARSADVTRPP